MWCFQAIFLSEFGFRILKYQNMLMVAKILCVWTQQVTRMRHCIPFIFQELKRSGSDCRGSLGALVATDGCIKAASMNKPSFRLRIASQCAAATLIIAVSHTQCFILCFDRKRQKYRHVRETVEPLVRLGTNVHARPVSALLHKAGGHCCSRKRWPRRHCVYF